MGEKSCTSHVRWRKSSVPARNSLGYTQHPRGAGRLRSEMRRERQREVGGKHRLEVTGDLERETGQRCRRMSDGKEKRRQTSGETERDAERQRQMDPVREE